MHFGIDTPASGTSEIARQGLRDGIYTLGETMSGLGLEYQESGGRYMLATTKHFEGEKTKSLVIGVGAGAAAALLMGFFIFRK